jgi:hypothetical protein
MNNRPRPLWRFLRIAAFTALPGVTAIVAGASPGAVAAVCAVVAPALETAWRAAYPLEVPSASSSASGDPPP